MKNNDFFIFTNCKRYHFFSPLGLYFQFGKLICPSLSSPFSPSYWARHSPAVKTKFSMIRVKGRFTFLQQFRLFFATILIRNIFKLRLLTSIYLDEHFNNFHAMQNSWFNLLSFDCTYSHALGFWTTLCYHLKPLNAFLHRESILGMALAFWNWNWFFGKITQL